MITISVTIKERLKSCNLANTTSTKSRNYDDTSHVETAVLLSQRKADDYIEVELELDELDVTSSERR